MNLIDWVALTRNALWILGLSIALAAWSYAWWQAGQLGLPRRHMLNGSSFQALFASGMLLFAAGMAWGALRWWETVLWIILGLLFLWQALAAWRSRSDDILSPPPSDTGAETFERSFRIEQAEDPNQEVS